MIALRSILFAIAFYTNTIIRMIVLSPFYFILPRSYAIPKSWARSNLWLQRNIIGTTFEIEGLSNIPEGGYILCAKHQSFWDTFGILPWLSDPVYVLKRELLRIPLFGWYLSKQRMIPVDRGARGRAALDVFRRTREELAAGRQLIIYPEGTRRIPGDEPVYKNGIARMYRDLDVPVVPIVMHPGLFWPRSTFKRYPGHFKVRILPPIQPGLKPDAFFKKLVSDMEEASDALLIETVAANPHVPLPQQTAKRLEELKAGSRPVTSL